MALEDPDCEAEAASLPPLPWDGSMTVGKVLVYGGLAIASVALIPPVSEVVRAVCASIGLTLAAIGGIALGATATCRRRAARDIEGLARGEYLARWEIAPEEWNSLCERLYDKTDSHRGTMVLLLMVVGALFSLCFLAVAGAWVIAVGALGGAILGAMVASLTSFFARENYGLTSEPVVVWITRRAVYWQRRAVSWTVLGMTLHEVKLRDDDGAGAVLELTIRVHNTNGGWSYQTYPFPVPTGHEGEAEAVVAALGMA